MERSLPPQVLNTGRLARCVQEDAQEAENAQQSAQQQLEDRLAALEEAVACLPRHEDRRAPQVRPTQISHEVRHMPTAQLGCSSSAAFVCRAVRMSTLAWVQ